MTRRYALVQLLRLGPLTRAQIAAVTGWPSRSVDSAISHLCETGVIVRKARRRCGVYQVVT